MFTAFVVIVAVVNLLLFFFYKGHILDKLNHMADQQACESQ